MFTLLYNPYLVKWFTRGEGGVKKGQNLVHVVCECPHSICLIQLEKLANNGRPRGHIKFGIPFENNA